MSALLSRSHGTSLCGVTPSVPNRPARLALGTAGLAQAFSETAGPGCWQPAFQKKKPGLAWVTCRPQVFNPNLNPQNAISTD